MGADEAADRRRGRAEPETQPRTAANARIRPDATGPGQDQPLTTSMLVRGYFHRWWQVMGSNHRRLSRRFYREPPTTAEDAIYLQRRRHRGGPSIAQPLVNHKRWQPAGCSRT